MSDHDRNRISERAYALWEEEGRPDGGALDHWAQASQEIEEQRRAVPEAPLSPEILQELEKTDGPDKIPLYP